VGGDRHHGALGGARFPARLPGRLCRLRQRRRVGVEPEAELAAALGYPGREAVREGLAGNDPTCAVSRP
jgi:hypothetical protein